MNAASWVTAGGVIVALIIGTGTVSQRWYADRRVQRWSRTQWAMDLSLETDNPDKVEVGLEVLRRVATPRIRTRRSPRPCWPTGSADRTRSSTTPGPAAGPA